MKLVLKGCPCAECLAHARVQAAFDAADRLWKARKEQRKAQVIPIGYALALRAVRGIS